MKENYNIEEKKGPLYRALVFVVFPGADFFRLGAGRLVRCCH